jgi:3-phenylpropionate/cinnamic acid dioxygenase small subunit
MTDELGVLEAKLEIGELVFRYGYALDSRDWDKLRTCFLPDVVGYYGGDPLRGYEAIEDLCRTTLEPLSASQHLIGNVVVTVDGDGATSSCYLHAQHVRPGTEGGEQFIFAGRYLDRLVRTGEGWRIAERTLEAMWTSGNAAVIARPLRTLDGDPT